MLPPFTFQPIFKERVWGGRRLATLFGKDLPEGRVIGESWELTDRPEGVSVVASGPFAGRDLRWLMEHHGEELLGRPVAAGERFPWLIKILDCTDDLSLQVHPPLKNAAALGGEPKTELWYVAAAEPGSKLYVGLRQGVSQADFEQGIIDGSVADCLHVQPVIPGDAMFVPSGRVHALGKGNLVFEIQQNSDTTYRVFDWNRLGLDGRPRDLHVAQSLASIDFTDFEPRLVDSVWKTSASGGWRELVQHSLFQITQWRCPTGANLDYLADTKGPLVLGVTAGVLQVTGSGPALTIAPGGFCFLPARRAPVKLEVLQPAEFLQVNQPQP